MLHCQRITLPGGTGARDILAIGARPAGARAREAQVAQPCQDQRRSAHDDWAIAQAAASKAEFDLHHAQMVAIEHQGLPVADERVTKADALRARATTLLNLVLAELARDPGRSGDPGRPGRDD